MLKAADRHLLENARKDQKGFVLVAAAVGFAAVLGAAGLAVDLGRVYIARNEVQAFADSAALAAALQLNGTSAGITAANLAVQSTPNKWNLGTQSVSNATVQFAVGSAANGNQPDAASWTATPASGSNYRFVRVIAGADVPVMLAQAIGAQSTMHVAAVATGGQLMVTTYADGLLPFSPIAPNAADTVDYGFQTGQLFTLRYPSGGGQNKGNVCAGDVNGSYWANLPAQDRGYWGSNSAAAIRGEIVDDTQVQPLTIGDNVPMVGGNKTTEGSALETRVEEDSDPTSLTYQAYAQAGLGNGRRVFSVPVNSGSPDFAAISVRAFFLQAQGVYSAVTGTTSICAEYIGTYVQGGGVHIGAGQGTGGYLVRLTQ
ncbi:MAG: pilus assembly protein TadG-related protein [Acidobacteriota bacterium]|nr:pilus assembly protein TadG-related protein [Acidobacteriota bacterium]